MGRGESSLSFVTCTITNEMVLFRNSCGVILWFAALSYSWAALLLVFLLAFGSVLSRSGFLDSTFVYIIWQKLCGMSCLICKLGSIPVGAGSYAKRKDGG